MKIFFKELLKIFRINLLILLSFIFVIELVFGYWFDKDNFGPYMREHRMKNDPIIFKYKDKVYKYNYKRNYYGFRGEHIEPENIEAIIMGGSGIDERYKPDEFTITGFINKNLKKNKYNFKIINAGIEAQSSAGMIYNFKNWFGKLKNFSPKIILFYIGLNENAVPVDETSSKLYNDGHVLNPEKIDVFFDTIKSKSFFYDTARIFKFKYLPRKNFVKYDGNIDKSLKSNFQYITYDYAIKNYDIDVLKKNEKITKFLSRVDTLYENSKKINSNPIFITSIGSNGYSEASFMYNYFLISHCKIKKYNCIDLAKKLNAKNYYWKDGTHTTKEGSEEIGNLIYEDLIKLIEKKSLFNVN